MIPPLDLKKYLITSTQPISHTKKSSPTQQLPTPPTSPDKVSPTNKRKHTSDHTPSSPKRMRLDLNLLQLYLSSGKSVHVRDGQYGLNLLCWACQCQSIEAVDQILQQGSIDINQRHGPHQITALHLAALTNFHQGLQRLVDHPNLDINQRDTHGLTAVHYAARHDHHEALSVLMEAGARIDIYDRQGKLPVHHAVLHGSPQVVRTLLEHRERNNPTELNLIWSSSPLHVSSLEEVIVSTGNPKTLQVLIEAGAFVARETEQVGWWEDCYGPELNQLFERCVYWNRLSCLVCLMPFKDRSRMVQLEPVLYLAVQQRKLDLVRYLVDHKINPCRSDGSNPSLLYAVNHGFMDMIPLLLTPTTSYACVQRASLFAHMIGQSEAWSRLVQLYWKS